MTGRKRAGAFGIVRLVHDAGAGLFGRRQRGAVEGLSGLGRLLLLYGRKGRIEPGNGEGAQGAVGQSLAQR